jgi:hypothetical protein
VYAPLVETSGTSSFVVFIPKKLFDKTAWSGFAPPANVSTVSSGAASWSSVKTNC